MDSMKDKLLSAPKFHIVKGERINTKASDVLNEVELLQVKSAIKALNQRMREFERASEKYGKGYTDNTAYKNLRAWADTMATNKSGYAKQSTTNLTVAQAIRTMAILKNPKASLRAFNEQNANIVEEQGGTISRTTSGAVRRTQENALKILSVAGDVDKIHKFIEDNANFLYALQSNENDMNANTLVAGSDKLVKALQSSSSGLDPDDTATMLQIMAMFDSKNEELQEIKYNYIAKHSL